MINIAEIDKKTFNHFYEENLSLQTTFLQSINWGEFQQRLNNEILYLGFFHNKNIEAIALVILVISKKGNFLFIPHGPIFSRKINNDYQLIKKIIEKITEYLKNLAIKRKISFIRIAPILEDSNETREIFKELNYRDAPIYMHAETTWVLRIKEEQEMFANMRKTTRYLIKKALKNHSLIIEKRTDDQAVFDFYKIYKITAKREKFTPFSFEYIKNEFYSFKNNSVFIFIKDKNEKNYLASALIIFNKNCGFYHHGASIHTKIPAAYLLQWEAIKETKRRGCSYYNFWGIYDEQKKRTPKSWKGLTLFKTGFGGEKINYLTTQDYVISKNYYFTYIIEKFTMIKRMI